MSALVLANGHLGTIFSKTTNGLIRGPSRFPLAGVIDRQFAGRDAGEILDGQHRGLPIFADVPTALAQVAERPTHAIVGVATSGGVLPDDLYADLCAAAESGLTLVNGLHRLLSEDARLVTLTQENGGHILDLRKPKPAADLHFWTGEVLQLDVPRVAVLGTDCAVGKRTTAVLLRDACRRAGLRAEVVYTGQTGWLQGLDHGFIFDATLNDFVSGELEHAILACAQATDPEVIFLEGQSSLRNPSGPAGAEFLLSGGAKGVLLQHAPARRYYVDMEEIGCEIPPIEQEIALIELLGADVWAITLHSGGLSPTEARAAQRRLAAQLGRPVFLPLEDGFEALVTIVQTRVATGSTQGT